MEQARLERLIFPGPGRQPVVVPNYGLQQAIEAYGDVVHGINMLIQRVRQNFIDNGEQPQNIAEDACVGLIRGNRDYLQILVQLHDRWLAADDGANIWDSYNARIRRNWLEQLRGAHDLVLIGIREREEQMNQPIAEEMVEGRPANARRVQFAEPLVVPEPHIEAEVQPPVVEQPPPEQPEVQPAEVAVPVVEAVPIVEEPAEEAAENQAVVDERVRMDKNRAHTPNRFSYMSRKRNAEHFNADPDCPQYVHVAAEEITKHNFLWFFTKRRRPRYSDFADTDLVNYLRFHTFCVPRTPTLIQTLKLKAIRFMSDFDMGNHTMEQIYRIMATSVAAAMVITPEEELIRETISDHSNMITKYQPFFQTGQYRAGFLGYGIKSLV